MKSCLTSLVIIKMQIQNTVWYYFISARMKYYRKITMYDGEKIEKLEHWYTAGGNTKYHSRFGKQIDNPLMIKGRVFLWPSNSTEYMSKRNKYISTPKTVYDYLNSITHINKRWKQHISINFRMNKQDMYAHTIEYSTIKAMKFWYIQDKWILRLYGK